MKAKAGSLLLPALLALLLGGNAAAQKALRLVPAGTFVPPFELADCRLADLDGDGQQELLLVGIRGEVRTWKPWPATRRIAKQLAGQLVLPDPTHTILALAELTGRGGPPELVAASPRGVMAYRVDSAGAFSGKQTRLTPKGRRRGAFFPLRVDRPTFVDICHDINNDHRPDLLLPMGNHAELWLNPGLHAASPPEALPLLHRAARIPVHVARSLQYMRQALSDSLESSFVIPRVRTEDINGDGREDLLLENGRRRAFHIQHKDGSIPPRPTVALDLSIFRDTTPRARLGPGRILAGANRQIMQSRDLTGDGIPDYVIAHRRKIWVFHGTRQGPQFSQPAQILKSAEDITTLLLADLNGDARPDLVLLKVQIPSITSIILSALGSFTVEVDAAGYALTPKGTFQKLPRWKSRLSVKVPPVRSILRNPDAIIRRFEEASARFVDAREVDLDHDGRQDVLLLSPEGKSLRIWLGTHKSQKAGETPGDALIRNVLFEDTNKEWDLDRIISWLGSVAQREIRDSTGGRPPDIELTLDRHSHLRLQSLRTGDLDGDGRHEIVLGYRPLAEGGHSLLEIYRLRL